MVINILEVIEYVDRNISAHFGVDYSDNIVVIIPILYHVKTDDNIIIITESSDNHDMKPDLNKDFMAFDYKIRNRCYKIYENWYDYKGEKNDFDQIYQYMSQYKKLMYHIDMSCFPIYYRVKHGFDMDSNI